MGSGRSRGQETGQDQVFSTQKSRGDIISGENWENKRIGKNKIHKIQLMLIFWWIFLQSSSILDLIILPSMLFLYMVYFSCDNDAYILGLNVRIFYLTIKS